MKPRVALEPAVSEPRTGKSGADSPGSARFEAFDEPWKVQFNTAGKNWEDKWGLMTIDRKLKPGVKIPDCGGKSVPRR